MLRQAIPVIVFCIALTTLTLVPSVSAQGPTSDTERDLQPSPYSDAQERADDLLNKSLGSIDESYRGVPQWYRDDIVARGLDKLWSSVAPRLPTCEEVWEAISERLGKLYPDLCITGITIGSGMPSLTFGRRNGANSCVNLCPSTRER